jgi:hypothetical protein
VEPIIPLKEISLVAPVDGHDYAAFLVTNLAKERRSIGISLTGLDASAASLDLFETPFIRSAAMEYVADPIVPVSGPFTLRSGESRMIIVSAHGLRPGLIVSHLKITSGEMKVSLPVQMRIANISFPQRFSLNSMPWAYLNYPLTKNRVHAVLRDLRAHHTNTFIVPPAHLPLVNSKENPDFTKMKQYLDARNGIDKIMLSMNFKTEDPANKKGPYRFMDQNWQKSFRRWYDGALTAAAEKGFSSEQVYLYPFDEMHGKEIDEFIDFATWIRKEFSKARLYATFGWADSERAQSYVDIAQIVNKDEILGKFSSAVSEKWLYDTLGLAKSLSPYSYYRMMAWKAFYGGYKGIGFWSYADAGWGANPGTAWDDFDGLRPDYTVIYEGENASVISSRRWEAWMMGIEDYELLTMYAKKKGDAAARALAREVMDNPSDSSRADRIRRQMLSELER